MREFRGGGWGWTDISVRTTYQSVARIQFPSMKAFDATGASRRGIKGSGKIEGKAMRIWDEQKGYWLLEDKGASNHLMLIGAGTPLRAGQQNLKVLLPTCPVSLIYRESYHWLLLKSGFPSHFKSAGQRWQPFPVLWPLVSCSPVILATREKEEEAVFYGPGMCGVIR